MLRATVVISTGDAAYGSSQERCWVDVSMPERHDGKIVLIIDGVNPVTSTVSSIVHLRTLQSRVVRYHSPKRW